MAKSQNTFAILSCIIFISLMVSSSWGRRETTTSTTLTSTTPQSLRTSEGPTTRTPHVSTSSSAGPSTTRTPSNETDQEDLSTNQTASDPITACDEPYYRQPFDWRKYLTLGESMLQDYRWYTDHLGEWVLDVILNWFYNGLLGFFF